MSTARASTPFPIGAELTCVGAGIASTSAATTARTSVRSSNGLILMRMGSLSLSFMNGPAKSHAASASPPLRCSLAPESGANDALWRQTRHKKVLMPARSRFRGSIDECAKSSGGAYGLVWGRGSFGDDCVGVRTPDGGMSFGHSDQRDGAAPYASLEGADPAAGVVEVGPAPGVGRVELPADPQGGCGGAAGG